MPSWVSNFSSHSQIKHILWGGFIHLWAATCLPLRCFFIDVFVHPSSWAPSHTFTRNCFHSSLLFFLPFFPPPSAVSFVHSFQTHTESLTFSLVILPLSPSLHLHPASLYLPVPLLIQMHGCIFGLCRDSLAPGGFSWNQFTLPVPSHWSTIYRPSTAGAAGSPFNRCIRCLTWQSIYSGYSPCFGCKERNISAIPVFHYVRIFSTPVLFNLQRPSCLLTCCPSSVGFVLRL